MMLIVPANAQKLSDIRSKPSVADIAGATQFVIPFTPERGTCYRGPVAFVTSKGEPLLLLPSTLSFPFGCDTVKSSQFTKTVSPK